MKEVLGQGGGLNLSSLNCAFLPRACKYELQVIFFFISRQHYCIILVASLKKVYCILGRVLTIRLIIKKDKALVCKKKKRIAIMFSFCWLVKTVHLSEDFGPKNLDKFIFIQLQI